jgi:hypothetical protein
MAKSNFKDEDPPGFTRYWQDTNSKGILLPAQLAEAIKVATVQAAAAEKKAIQDFYTGEKPKPVPAVVTWFKPW